MIAIPIRPTGCTNNIFNQLINSVTGYIPVIRFLSHFTPQLIAEICLPVYQFRNIYRHLFTLTVTSDKHDHQSQ